MKEQSKGCILEYLFYLIEISYYFISFILINAWWILTAILVGAVIFLIIDIVEKGY